LKKYPHWRGYGLYTLISGVFCVILLSGSFADFFVPGQVAFYLFLAVILVWIEVVAIRLRSIPTVAMSGRAAPAG
jgi:hypothetical protein